MISKNTLQLLEYDRLLGIISTACHSEISKEAVLDISPFESVEDIRSRFLLVEDIRRIFQQGSSLPLISFQDIMPLLLRARPQGAVLDASEIASFVPVLDMAGETSRLIQEMEDLGNLAEFASGLTGRPELHRGIQRAIDPEGNIKDSASPALAAIRRDLRRLEGGIQKRLEEMTRESSVSVFLQDSFITKRAGRWVIPVRMDSKGQVPGVVHDISKSGETAFIEPLDVIHLSNELENLSAEEKAEELRILRALSSMIREDADLISEEFRIIVQIDMLNSIARFADRLSMEIPEIGPPGRIRLINARHPLLAISYKRAGSQKDVVPLDLELGDKDKVMVITGSNAGGKTIAIKTTGLLICMALSGLPVPASSGSIFPLVSSLLVDIGDEQSIESNLSTFSAHIRNISGIIDAADRASVILIDELGTGTDPDEGTALSCAVLKELQQKGSLVFATTHLMGIKGYVQQAGGMANASMEFDNKTLTPLYRLRTGEPGQSHALEIARKYGLQQHVVNSAKELIGTGKIKFDELMADLNEKRSEYERLLEELQKKQRRLEEREKQADQRLHEADTKKREMLAEAHREALDIVSDVKRQMRTELDALKKKEKKEIQEKIRETELKQKQITDLLSKYEADDGEAIHINDLHPGDMVYVKSLGYDGTVSGIIEKTNRVKVVSGTKEILVPLSDIRVKKGRVLSEKKQRLSTKESPDEMTPSRINLIGMRVDEALSQLEPFMNHAALAGFREITIIHGFGTGALAKAVREHLKNHPLIAKFRYGESSEGGGGVTVAVLK